MSRQGRPDDKLFCFVLLRCLPLVLFGSSQCTVWMEFKTLCIYRLVLLTCAPWPLSSSSQSSRLSRCIVYWLFAAWIHTPSYYYADEWNVWESENYPQHAEPAVVALVPAASSKSSITLAAMHSWMLWPPGGAQLCFVVVVVVALEHNGSTATRNTTRLSANLSINTHEQTDCKPRALSVRLHRFTQWSGSLAATIAPLQFQRMNSRPILSLYIYLSISLSALRLRTVHLVAFVWTGWRHM